MKLQRKTHRLEAVDHEENARWELSVLMTNVRNDKNKVQTKVDRNRAQRTAYGESPLSGNKGKRREGGKKMRSLCSGRWIRLRRSGELWIDAPTTIGSWRIFRRARPELGRKPGSSLLFEWFKNEKNRPRMRVPQNVRHDEETHMKKSRR